MSHEPIAAPPAWSLGRRILFCFFFCYFVIYIVPFPATLIDHLIPWWGVCGWVQKNMLGPYKKLWDQVVLWTGQHVFGVAITIRPGGSGDTNWNYVQVFCFLANALAGTLIWSAVDFRRRRYDRLHQFLTTCSIENSDDCKTTCSNVPNSK